MVRIFNHAFQAPSTKWFVDNCPTTLTQPCPVCEANSALWNGANKNLASLRKRKMYYISSVLVVSDQKQPENEGKVFLFKYGVKIFGKIKDAITPPFGDTEPIDPFDPEAGANFRLRITRNGNGTVGNARRRGPRIDRHFYPRRHGNRAYPAMLTQEVHDAPAAVPLLDVCKRQCRHFGPA